MVGGKFGQCQGQRHNSQCTVLCPRSIWIPLRPARSDMGERCNVYVKVEDAGIQVRTAPILPSLCHTNVAHCPSSPPLTAVDSPESPL
jgi:hypothetical protein